MTKNFQKQIRNSPLWPQMVAEFGEEKALELLEKCKAEIKHEAGEGESGEIVMDSNKHHGRRPPEKPGRAGHGGTPLAHKGDQQ